MNPEKPPQSAGTGHSCRECKRLESELTLVNIDRDNRRSILSREVEQHQEKLVALTQLQDEVNRLRSALQRYGRHHHECEAVQGQPCTCGLNEALTAAKAAQQEEYK